MTFIIFHNFLKYLSWRYFHFLPDLLCLLEQQNSLLGVLSCLQLTGPVFWNGFGKPFQSQISRVFYVSFIHFPIDHFTNQSWLFFLDLSDTFADYGVHLSTEQENSFSKHISELRSLKPK